MTQLLIAAIFVGAFVLFMGGYSLGWRHRGRADLRAVAKLCEPAQIDGLRRDVEAEVRRSHR